MYVKRVRVVNYGPIEQLDIEFPFEGDKPKPVVLVGENGSGKSIVLSHIVNGLVGAKDAAFPSTPEVAGDTAYKIRSGSYIKSGNEFYYSRVDLEEDYFIEEIRSVRPKREYPDLLPEAVGHDLANAWNSMAAEAQDHIHSNLRGRNRKGVKDLLTKRCILFFPSNRFEDPAWLNERNLNVRPTYKDTPGITGMTDRKLICYSSLHDNQNWLFDVIYDRAVFEMQTEDILVQSSGNKKPLYGITRLLGHHGEASAIHEASIEIARFIIGERQDAMLSVSRRYGGRSISINTGSRHVSVFHLSSGEIALLNLFLSILRDFDLAGTPFSTTEEVRGVVVVDEIDLHLHAIHQYEVLPNLMRMFPNVQFIVTTHSPLFVLGMNKIFGEQGFVIHRLPSGAQISPEEFSEFESAYQAFTETNKFSGDIRTAIEDAKKPVVFMEGKTDVAYVSKAAHLLGRVSLLGMIELLNGSGFGDLDNIWKTRTVLDGYAGLHRVILLYDCERKVDTGEYGRFFRRSITKQENHPVDKGIENLFAKSTLEKARTHKEFLDMIIGEHSKTVHGTTITVPETWRINKAGKTNLCDWLCENGAAEDFQHFRVIFDLIEELVSGECEDPTAGTEPAVVETPKSNNGASRPAGG